MVAVSLFSDWHILDGEHGEVIALLGVANKMADGLGHGLYQLLGRTLEGGKDAGDALIAKQLMPPILGLRQSVGKEEDGAAGNHVGFLLGEVPVRLNAYGEVAVAMDG